MVDAVTDELLTYKAVFTHRLQYVGTEAEAFLQTQTRLSHQQG